MRSATLIAISALLVLSASPAPARELPDELQLTVGGNRKTLFRHGNNAPSLPPPSVMGKPVLLSAKSTSIDAIEIPPAPQRLIIVTTQTIVERSARLQTYVDWRVMGGWEVIIGLEQDWDHPTARDGDDRQARIRAWLKTVYAERGAGYLLLIGDPHPEGNGVPMRRTQPLGDLLWQQPEPIRDSLSDVPTDHYYADLDSDWDCDADGTFGEYPDDSGEGCADWGPELIVGRIPEYREREPERLDAILTAVMAHEQRHDKSYRDAAILAGAFGGFRGQSTPGGEGEYDEDDDLAVFLDRIATDLPLVGGITPQRLYEDDGILVSSYAHELPLTADQLFVSWLAGASTVSWGGHGSAVSSHRQVWVADSDGDTIADDLEISAPAFINSSWAESLAEAPGAVVHMMSCLNGYPEVADNLGYALLGRGAIATASASRSAVGISGLDWEPRPELATATTASYYFTLLVQAGHRVGDALAYTKWGLPADGWAEYGEAGWYDLSGYGWLTKLEYNIYGDPTLSLERCAGDADCDDGLPCNGVESCQLGYCVRSEPVSCTGASAPCTHLRCINATGACEAVATIDGTSCDDGLWCTLGDVCVAGSCASESRDCPAVEGYTPACDDQHDECILVPIADHEPDPDDEEEGAGGADDPSRSPESPPHPGCRAVPTDPGYPGFVLIFAIWFTLRRTRRFEEEQR